MNITNLDTLHTHVLEQYPMEAVGMVIHEEFIPLANIASSPFENFLVEQGTYLTYEKEIEAIIHSHTYKACGADPRAPSKPDLMLARNTGKPQGILHCNGTEVSDILFFNLDTPAPLLGRTYIPGVYDCLTIVTDYYKLKHDLVMDNMPRDTNWLETEPMLLKENLDNQGFTKVRKGAEIEGDVLIFAYGTREASHLGIYIGDGKFIHHLKHIPSCEDKLSKYPRQHLYTYRRTG